MLSPSVPAVGAGACRLQKPLERLAKLRLFSGLFVACCQRYQPQKKVLHPADFLDHAKTLPTCRRTWESSPHKSVAGSDSREMRFLGLEGLPWEKPMSVVLPRFHPASLHWLSFELSWREAVEPQRPCRSILYDIMCQRFAAMQYSICDNVL